MSVESIIGHLEAAEDAVQELAAENARLTEELGAVETICRYGPSVPMVGWAAVDSFVAKTGLQPELIRCYPGGTNSLSQVRTAIQKFANVAIVYNMHVASKNLTQTQIDTLVKVIEVEAAKVPRFVLCPDAEPDRPRSYTTEQFIASFKRVALSVERYAPHVELSLCLTGWDFSSRVGQYDPLLPLYDLLLLDVYWEPPNAGGVQGDAKNLDDALLFCDATGKRMGLGEWGATNGDYKLLAEGLKWIRQHPVCELSCYYVEGGAVPIKGELTTDAAFAVYKAGAAQP